MIKKIAAAIPLAALVGLYLKHFAVVVKTAVDIPFWDEWEMWPLWQAEFPWGWLFTQHNEHKIVPTRILVWLMNQFTGDNKIPLIIVNFLIFGLLVGSLYWFARETTKRISPAIILSFLVFLVSPVAWENHTWGFQSQIHFVVLFQIVAAVFLFREKQSRRELTLGIVFGILALFSFSSGLPGLLILTLGYAGFKRGRIKHAVSPRKRSSELTQLLVVSFTFIAGMAAWFSNFHKIGYHPPWQLPYKAVFWKFFLNTVSFGFGFKQLHLGIGIVCFLLVVTPLIILFRRRSIETPAATKWALASIVGAILGGIGAITLGRAGFPLGVSKAPHYGELTAPLIIFAAIGWILCLQNKPKQLARALVGVWLVCFVGYFKDWDYKIYYEVQTGRLVGIECVKKYYAEGGDGNCPSLFGAPIKPYLEYARQFKPSFYYKTQSFDRKIGLVP